MCRAAQVAGARANGSEYINRNNKVRFLRIPRSVTFYLQITKFAVELLAYKGKLDSKIEVNCARLFRDTFQFLFFVFFFSFFVFLHKSQNRL